MDDGLLGLQLKPEIGATVDRPTAIFALLPTKSRLEILLLPTGSHLHKLTIHINTFFDNYP
jgi:hypothetical protein